jgi:hypothetical protein
MELNFFNPWSSKFLKLSKDNDKAANQYAKQTVGKGEEDISVSDQHMFYDGPGFDVKTSNITFNQYFADKKARIGKYREMAGYPEISNAIDILVDECIAKSPKGDAFSFEFLKTNDMTRAQIRDIKQTWDLTVKTLLNFDEVGWELFYKWVVDGELYLEVVLDKKGTDVIGLKPLPSYTMVPIYDNGTIIKYMQIEDGMDPVPFEKNQILYISYGKYGFNKQDVRGYLDNTVRIYNQLKTLEDAILIYRLIRAPERRVWNIEVGQAPSGKADELVKQVMNRYKKRLNYNSETGMIDSANNFQALTEDFWFARRDGAGSTVDVMQGGQQLGEIEDVNYFLRKMYKSLKLPQTRWGEPLGASGTTYTNTKDIEREELNYVKFAERLQMRFKRLPENLFIFLLQLKGYDEKFLDRKRYRIVMQMNNHFRQYRENELIREKLDMINTYADLVLRKDNPNGVISQEFFLDYIVNLPGNLNEINKQMVSSEREHIDDEGGFELPPD